MPRLWLPLLLLAEQSGRLVVDGLWSPLNGQREVDEAEAFRGVSRFVASVLPTGTPRFKKLRTQMGLVYCSTNVKSKLEPCKAFRQSLSSGLTHNERRSALESAVREIEFAFPALAQAMHDDFRGKHNVEGSTGCTPPQCPDRAPRSPPPFTLQTL
jgi:hypothetical protein